MPVTDRTTFVNQVGDVRMEANIEYRTKLFWKFELAAYVDAGNIWTAQKYDYQPNGDFSFDRFYKEIAVSYGLGLRMDFDYFLVRFDTGMKARNPQQTGDRKWAILYPLDKNQFAWHFAVGYPF
jgi:outer membrane protein assembly factor BamA